MLPHLFRATATEVENFLKLSRNTDGNHFSSSRAVYDEMLQQGALHNYVNFRDLELCQTLYLVWSWPINCRRFSSKTDMYETALAFELDKFNLSLCSKIFQCLICHTAFHINLPVPLLQIQICCTKFHNTKVTLHNHEFITLHFIKHNFETYKVKLSLSIWSFIIYLVLHKDF